MPSEFTTTAAHECPNCSGIVYLKRTASGNSGRYLFVNPSGSKHYCFEEDIPTDPALKGRGPSKLTWSTVNQIRQLHRDRPELHHRDIAEIHGVTKANVTSILNEHTWPESQNPLASGTKNVV